MARESNGAKSPQSSGAGTPAKGSSGGSRPAKKAPAEESKPPTSRPKAPATSSATKPAAKPALKKTSTPPAGTGAKKATKKATARPSSPAAPRLSPEYTPPVVVSVLPAEPECSCVPPLMTGRFPVIDVSPTVESGRRPAKAVVGECVPIEATAFREGHDALGVEVELHRPDGRLHQRVTMTDVGSGVDRFRALVSPDEVGDWSYSIVAWSDPWATWLHRAQIKVLAGIDIELELEEGARLIDRAASSMPAEGKSALARASATVRNDQLPPAVRLAAATDRDIASAMAAHPLREHSTSCGPWPLRVERRRALVGSWYEFFPRSEGATATKSGTFATASARLDAIAAMGFDVVYLPPIHPIGTSYRKGPNNTLTPGPDDPGSPWAIGSPAGGHDAIHPDLGTEEDFVSFVERTRALGMEVALDLALQASPDHPWVTSHPEWFTARADGSIAYAENPPKKYQDIYPLQFDRDPEGLYAEVLRVVRHWMALGVRIFRVDNPHTKPLWLWDRLTNEVWATDPDVLFLAEAFTRPPMMRALAEVGFQQSYTYFTWRNDQQGLVEYFSELAGPAAAYMRPNVFVNTPDILHEYLQHGGPAAFAIRAALAATLSPTWGVYSGYELFEHRAVREGSEEYLDSEKYQYRPRDWAAAEAFGSTLAPYITQLNALRRESPALQDLRSLRFHFPDNDQVLAFSKEAGDELLLIVCSLNPHHAVEATVWWDLESLGIPADARFIAHDLISQETWNWGVSTYVRLDPQQHVAHIVRVTRP